MKLSFDNVGIFPSTKHMYVFLPIHLHVEGEVKLCNLKHHTWDDLELIACNSPNTELAIQVYVNVLQAGYLMF